MPIKIDIMFMPIFFKAKVVKGVKFLAMDYGENLLEPRKFLQKLNFICSEKSSSFKKW